MFGDFRAGDKITKSTKMVGEICPKCNIEMDRCAKITDDLYAPAIMDIFYICRRCGHYIDTEEVSSLAQ